ncbi:MAG: TatD family deoxyribonuclease [Lachnospiraceae bacterium]|nr:TatD family deoxyribonuclease [Lachnospiraceae bacterium]
MEIKGIFDSHAHYEDRRFDEDRDNLLRGMKESGVDYIVNVGSSIDTTKKTILLTEQYDFIYGSAGVHPEECKDMKDDDLLFLEEVCKHNKIVAVGEIGLDYYWDEPARDIQKKWFRKQLELAVKVNLPVIIHTRDAIEDTMNILKEYTPLMSQGIHGVIHCFSGSAQSAAEFVKMGYYIGIGGVVTFKNAKKLKEVAQEIPIENIVIETDCPYMAPEPYRGKRNDSSYLSYVVSKLAKIKGISEQEVTEITAENALRMYRMNK